MNTIDFTNLDDERWFVGELGDIEISTVDLKPIEVKISRINFGVLCTNIYCPFGSSVHIDIREPLQNLFNTVLPSGVVNPFVPNPGSSLSIRLIVTSLQTGLSSSVDFEVILGDGSDIFKKMTDIDALNVPKDYLVPFALYNGSWEAADENDHFTVKFTNHKKSQVIGQFTLTKETGALAIGGYYLPELPVNHGMPFFLSFIPDWFSFPSSDGREIINTPILKSVEGHFEQYLFRNKYGAWDNVPMSGDIKFVPEYDIENTLHNGGHVKGHAVMDEIYEQNSGYLSRKTVKALSELLLSDEIYHLEDHEDDVWKWKRIIIDKPDIALSRINSVHSLTFRWTYAENDE